MRIVCFGDSLTRCGGQKGRFSDILQDRFPEHQIVNKGAGGEGFEEARERFEGDVLELHPDVVLIEFGANDWWRDERPYTAWAEDLEDVVVRCRSVAAQVVILGVFGLRRDRQGQMVPKVYGTDQRAEAFRELEERIAAKHGCEYIPNIQRDIVGNRCCWRDRNHPNEFGNRYVADIIEPVLAKLLGQAPLPVRKPVLRTTRDLWNEAVALAPHDPAVVCGQQRLTYAEAEEQVQKIAAGLYTLAGARPKVAVFLPNGLEYYLLYWAVQKLGGIIIPLNTWLKDDSLASIFDTVAPAVLVVQSGNDRTVLRGAGKCPGLTVFALKTTPGDGMRAFAELAAMDGAVPAIELPEDAESIIMHTSGTTAAPKGAVMRHSDLMFNVMTTINAHQFSASDVHLLVNPMFHCTALYSSLPTAAYQKTPVVITADTTPDGLMHVVQQERITTFLTVPSILQRIVALPNLRDYDWSSLRLIAYAGSPMPVHTIGQLQKHFPEVDLHNFFGLTETISMTHVLSGEDAQERPDSIGRLLPFVEARIVDEDLRHVAPGTVGELLFARDNVIPTYWNRPEKLQETIATIDSRKWFRTGDLAVIDEEGYFFIKGRQKDMIIVGGENVYAAELEGVLIAHPQIKDVAVKGVPATGIRESLGELIKAFIVPADPAMTERDVRKHCHEKLPSFKIPHIIEFREALPRNPAGKLVKAELD